MSDAFPHLKQTASDLRHDEDAHTSAAEALQDDRKLTFADAAKVVETGRLHRANNSPAERKTVRLSADLPADVAELLTETSAQTGSNKVTTIGRAIRTLATLLAAERAGGKLTVTYHDGSRERLTFL